MCKSSKDNSQSDSQVTPINIKRIKGALVGIGLLYLIGFTFAGIIIVQFIGWGIEELIGLVHAEWENFSMGNYVSDLLGGAIGLSIGLALDKICIEKYNNVNHYKALMRVVIQELDNISKAAKESKNGLRQGNTYVIKEYIFDDVVMTAETISVIANIPFAKEQVKDLIDKFSNAQLNIELYNELYYCKVKEIIPLVKQKESYIEERKGKKANGEEEKKIEEIERKIGEINQAINQAIKPLEETEKDLQGYIKKAKSIIGKVD